MFALEKDIVSNNSVEATASILTSTIALNLSASSLGHTERVYGVQVLQTQ